MSSDKVSQRGFRDWHVDCVDCGASYTSKARDEPEECFECGSNDLEVKVIR